MSKEAMKLNKIMEQAQVFASAWSLVGGRFDGGNAMDDAEVAKNELHQMVAEALTEQPAQQEPVAWIWKYANGEEEVVFVSPRHIDATHVDAPSTITPLYTSPAAQRPWVGLNDEEFESIEKATLNVHGIPKYFGTAIEAALRRKNT